MYVTGLRCGEGLHACSSQDHGLDAGLDVHLIPRCAPALPFGNAKPVPVYTEERALHTQRAIGTTLSHEVWPAPEQPYLLTKEHACT